MLLSWLRDLGRRRAKTRKIDPRKPFKQRFFRPQLESLEERCAPAVFTVDRLTDNNPGGGGQGSGTTGDLRYCILQTQTIAFPGPDTINFAVSGTINLQAALPPIQADVIGPDPNNQVTIDGWTSPGFNPATGIPAIVINGGTIPGGGANGLVIDAPNSLIRGLSIVNFRINTSTGIGGYGIIVRQTTSLSISNNTFVGNYIGVLPNGAAAGNDRSGIWIDQNALNTRIGGSGLNEGNIISDNGRAAPTGLIVPEYRDGITLAASGVMVTFSTVEIRNNIIGLNPLMNADFGNRENGIQVLFATGIGATPIIHDNVIAGNDFDGILLARDGNRIESNFIGVTPGGIAIGNSLRGILVTSSNNTIGGLVTPFSGGGTGPGTGVGNVIAGNGQEGIAITGNNNRVEGNLVGLAPGGMVARPNGGASTTSGGISIGGNNNTIGGADSGGLTRRNIISGNTGFGVDVDDGTVTTVTDNWIENNFIGLRIDGTTAAGIGNSSHGVLVRADAVGFMNLGVFNTTIINNTISGNGNFGDGTGHGVAIFTVANIDPTTPISGTVVTNNRIGTDPAGSNAAGFGNARAGIFISNRVLNTTITTNTIAGNGGGGIEVTTEDNGANDPQVTGLVIRGNQIGTNALGTLARPNSQSGISLTGNVSGAIIGGTVAGQGNTISGNTQHGIVITGGVANVPHPTGTLIQGNLIGVNAAATAALPNGGDGIQILAGANNTTIGGTVAGALNIISGNTGDGIEIAGTASLSTNNNTIQGNFIGTNTSGAAGLGNGGDGIRVLVRASGNVIGGAAPGAPNTIAGNGGDGIELNGANVTNTTIRGNFIGTTSATAAAVLPNGGSAILIDGNATNNLIGGQSDGEGNTIAHYGAGTFGVRDVTDQNNAIVSSLRTGVFVPAEVSNFSASGAFGIDVGAAGVTTPVPKLIAASSSLGTIRIGFTLADPVAGTFANGTYIVQFFANGSNAFRQGRTFLGEMVVNWTGSGTFVFIGAAGVSVPAGDFVTATATRRNGGVLTFGDNTSEFSAPIIVGAADLAITKADPPGNPIPGQNWTYTITLTNNQAILGGTPISTVGGDTVGPGVVVTDPLFFTAQGETVVSQSVAGPGTWSFTTPTVGGFTVATWTLTAGTLGPSASVTFTLTVSLPPGISGSLLNSAAVQVGPTVNDPDQPLNWPPTLPPYYPATVVKPYGQVGNTNNLSNQVSEPLQPTASLTVTKTLVAGSGVAGTMLTYQIVVTNPSGPSVATGVQINDVTPVGTVFADIVSASNWTINSAPASGTAGTIIATYNFGLGVGASTSVFQFRVTILPSTTGVVSNFAQATNTTATPGPYTSNTVNTTVTQSSNLTITKSTSPNAQTILAGSSIQYTIVVTNTGPSTASNVTITDLPGAPFVAAGSSWTAVYSAGSSGPTSGTGFINIVAVDNLTLVPQVTGTPGTLTPATVTITFTVMTDPAAPDQGLSNTVSTSTPSFNGGVPISATDNNDTLSRGANLQILLSNNGSAIPGSSAPGLIFTITVNNLGPSTSNGVTISDVVPGGVFTLFNWSVTGTTNATVTGPLNGTGVPVNTTANFGANGQVVITVTTNIQPSQGTTPFTYQVSVTPGSTPDPNSGNNTASNTINPTPRVHMLVIKDDGLVNAVPGTNVTYTITVQNLVDAANPSNLIGGTLTDFFPAAITAVSWTLSYGGGASGSLAAGTYSGNINFTISVPQGGTITIVATATISSAATGVLSNTATVTLPAGYTNGAGNLSATDNDNLTPQANLNIVKTGPLGSPAGTNITYTITLTNNGPSDAAGPVDVSDAILPASMTTFQATAQTSGPAFVLISSPLIGGNGTVTWRRAAGLVAGATVTFTITVQISAGAPLGFLIANTATVSSPTPEPPGGGTRSSTWTTTVTVAADLVLVKTDNPNPVMAGTTLTYTLTLTNNGPSTAQNVQITDPLPAFTTFVSLTAPGGWTAVAPPVGSNGTVTFTSASVPVGVYVFTIVVLVDPTTPSGTILTNTATASSITESMPGDESSTTNTPVIRVADVSVSKSDGLVRVAPGQQVTYTMVVANAGPSFAGATVTDFIPVSLLGASWTASPSAGATISAPSGSGNIAVTVTLMPGSFIVFQLTATVASTAPQGRVVNTITVTVDPDIIDPNPGNNTATDSNIFNRPIIIAATDTGSSEVKVYDATSRQLLAHFFAFPGFAGGVRVAAGDVNGDGIPDVIVGTGPGVVAQFKVFDGSNFSLLYWRLAGLAYNPSFTGGIFVASGDVNGDGFAEVIIGPDAGLAPEVLVLGGGPFNMARLREYPVFLGVRTDGGVRVAAGDINGDGYADVIAAAGPGGPALVEAHSGLKLGLPFDDRQMFYFAHQNYLGGLYVSAGDINGDGRDDIITGAGSSFAHVRVFSSNTTTILRDYYAYPATVPNMLTQTLQAPVWNAGVRVASVDVNGDGFDDILTAPGPMPEPLVKIFDSLSLNVIDQFFAYSTNFRGGVFLGAGG